MDARGEVAQVVDGQSQLGLRRVHPGGECRVRVGAKATARKTQRERQTDEPLLGAVMEVALELLALAVRRGHKPSLGGSQFDQLGTSSGLESFVFERDARRRRNLLDEPDVAKKVFVMHQQRDGLGVAHQSGGCPRLVPIGALVDRVALPVHASAVVERIGGTLSLTNARQSFSNTFTYEVAGDTMTWKVGAEHFVMRWRLEGDRLVFARDTTIGIAPTPMIIEPWTRQS
jgi:hypothetical protein